MRQAFQASNSPPSAGTQSILQIEEEGCSRRPWRPTRHGGCTCFKADSVNYCSPPTPQSCREPSLESSPSISPQLPWGSMTEVEPVLDFASSGRTGRRNALPDILGSPAGVSPTDLPLKLAEMSINSDRSQEMQSPATEVPPPAPQSPELKDTS